MMQPTYYIEHPLNITQQTTIPESVGLGDITELIDHYYFPISREEINIEQKFYLLKTSWRKETEFLSSINEIAMHPNYQKIIGMGTPVIPLILNEMRNEPGHWFWALKAISSEDPVPSDLKGKIKEMTIKWLQWGKNRGYIE